MSKRMGVLFAVFALCGAGSGCNALRGIYEFEIGVGNRTLHSIAIAVNAREVGQLPAGRTGVFLVEIKAYGNNNWAASNATAQANAAITARDLATGRLSREKRLWLVEGVAAYVDFESFDW